jgi:hypothetical protein
VTLLPLYPRVTSVAPLANYRLQVGFDDGSVGVVDCSHLVLGGGVGAFTALRDPSVFASVFVHPQSRTVSWPGNLDLDPDVLYAKAHSIPVPAE